MKLLSPEWQLGKSLAQQAASDRWWTHIQHILPAPFGLQQVPSADLIGREPLNKDLHTHMSGCARNSGNIKLRRRTTEYLTKSTEHQ